MVLILNQTVPKEFSVRHLQERSQTFMLRRKENESTWLVNYFFRRNRESSIESISLLKFIEENNLKKGDICIFELTKIANQITFVVHICNFWVGIIDRSTLAHNDRLLYLSLCLKMLILDFLLIFYYFAFSFFGLHFPDILIGVLIENG